MYIIAEMAWGHDGKIEKALAILEKAKRAGAHALGIHVTNMDAYMVPYYGSGKEKVSAGKEDRKIFEYLCEINISKTDWVRLAARAKEQGLDLVVMANDLPSLDFTLEKLNPAYLVLPAAAFAEQALVQAMIDSGKPLLLRIGGASLGEIEDVLGAIRAQTPDREIVLLYGHQNYPTQAEDNHMAVLPTLARLFSCAVGLADHHDADDSFALVLPCLAVALGATVVEKHLTFDRAERGEDFESALNEDEFARLTAWLDLTEKALGSGKWPANSASLARYRQIVRKKAIYAVALDKGQRLEASALSYKRSDVGVLPDAVPHLAGRILARAVAAGDPVLPEDFA